MYNNLTYTIVPSAEVVQEMVDVCLETSMETLRHTVTGEDLVIFKWAGATPAPLSGYTPYTHEEILAVVATSAWNLPLE